MTCSNNGLTKLELTTRGIDAFYSLGGGGGEREREREAGLARIGEADLRRGERERDLEL